MNVTLTPESRFSFVLGIVLSLLVLMTGPVRGDTTPESVRHLVQMPLATSKLSDVGYPDWEIRKLTRTLNEAGVAPRSFNQILASVPFFAGSLKSLKGVSNYVALQHERGLAGKELVTAIHEEINSRNLPWPSLLPADEAYLGKRTRNIIRRVKETVRERQGLEEGEAELGAPPAGGPPRSPTPTGPTGPRGPRRNPQRPF